MKNVQGGCSACSGEHLHLLILPLTCSLQFSLLDVSDTECTCAKSLSQVQFFESLWTVPPPSRLLCPWDSPGKYTGVGCHAHLQVIFPTQGLNPRLLSPLHWSHLESPLTQSRYSEKQLLGSSQPECCRICWHSSI